MRHVKARLKHSMARLGVQIVSARMTLCAWNSKHMAVSQPWLQAQCGQLMCNVATDTACMQPMQTGFALTQVQIVHAVGELIFSMPAEP